MTPTTASTRKLPEVNTSPAYFPVGRTLQLNDPHSGGYPPPRLGPAPVPGVGLGDLFAQLTRWSGIHAVWQWRSRRTGKPCGCAARRKRWNRIRLRSPVTFRG